ncbi:MAG: GMC oxidoreductase [Vicinamibacterales bacterium]
MQTDSWDIIIIGSGAGGGTLAHALAGTSARVLVLDRGDYIPQEPENWDPDAVWRDLRYRTDERWLDGDDRVFRPYTHYCVGGNTKFWGAVLYRFREEDFGALAHVDGVSPAWPIAYRDLAPYYDRAERLYQVRGDSADDPTEPPRGPFPHPAVPHEGKTAAMVEGLRQQGLHPTPLPLGVLRPGEPDGCRLCRTCNSFPCRVLAKSDADVCCVRPVAGAGNVTLWTNAYVTRLETDAGGRTVVAAEVEKDGEIVRLTASTFVVSCGAVNSAALLLRSGGDRHPDGLANSSGLVGRRYMAHIATMISATRLGDFNNVSFQKTIAINDFYLKGRDVDYPLGQIQSQGHIHPVMIQMAAPPDYQPLAISIPQWFYSAAWTAWSTEWLAMTEDLPHEENRVTVTETGHIRLTYHLSNQVAHQKLVDEVDRMLKGLGYHFIKPVSFGVGNTTHQCGTVVFGEDPKTSVLDPFCRAHDVDNLYVVDASFFPSSAAVNPGLTIAAQALRVADHLKSRYRL